MRCPAAPRVGKAAFEGKRLQVPPAPHWLCQRSLLPGEAAEGAKPGAGLGGALKGPEAPQSSREARDAGRRPSGATQEPLEESLRCLKQVLPRARVPPVLLAASARAWRVLGSRYRGVSFSLAAGKV